jgi:hypothetical protein
MKKIKINWIILLFSPSIFETYTYVINSNQSRTFQIPIYIKFNSTSTLIPISESDVTFTLNFTYPYGTLIVNEPVTINATITLKGVGAEQIQDTKIVFQNWLGYPNEYTEDDVPIQGALDFQTPLQIVNGSGNNIVDGHFQTSTSAQVVWAIDGDYKPLILFVFRDGTGYQTIDDNVVIHVYPNEQLTQIYANKVSVVLSLAVFIFSFVGVFALFFQLWDYETSKCNYKPKNNRASPNVKQSFRNKFNTRK